MKDTQQEAVYDWEGEFLDWNRQTLTLSSVRSYVRTACAHYGLRAPAVKHHSGNALAFYVDDGSMMSFPDWCMNPAVSLHEAAHHIVTQHFGKSVQDHGPTWLGVYMWLLETAGIAPRSALQTTARRRKLRWRAMPPEKMPKRARLEVKTVRALLRGGGRAPRFPRH